ncbi:hypothetical protein NC653_040424 [Populus alba x Populus x berolinensis]|uniref:Uncharacterized protein n=1 Tax=Populus alba x Populus x berolinensis TaxID=444605 RepID=A0AAD6LE00_9ROSI|nr:hypothetical protein NC653_040424 [Populus alba x Populus x berolinensis]
MPSPLRELFLLISLSAYAHQPYNKQEAERDLFSSLKKKSK